MKIFLIVTSIAIFSGSASAEPIIAANDVKVGQIVSASDIVTPKSSDGLRLAAGLMGKEARRNLYRGKPFTQSDLRSPVVVDRNAIVAMRFEKGPLVIETEGKSLDAGGVGDRIRIVNMQSKRIVTATVLDGNTVRAD